MSLNHDRKSTSRGNFGINPEDTDTGREGKGRVQGRDA